MQGSALKDTGDQQPLLSKGEGLLPGPPPGQLPTPRCFLSSPRSVWQPWPGSTHSKHLASSLKLPEPAFTPESWQFRMLDYSSPALQVTVCRDRVLEKDWDWIRRLQLSRATFFSNSLILITVLLCFLSTPLHYQELRPAQCLILCKILLFP